MMIRGILTRAWEGVIKRFSASGMIDVENREYIQHYGLTSLPQPGAEMVYQVEGNLVIALGSDDRRFRISLEDGEVALYDDLEQKVYLTRDGIVIKSALQVTLEAPELNLGGAREELRALVDERILELLNAHSHGGVLPGSGTTGPMLVPLVAVLVCTHITKAG